jgi:agarase
LIGVHRRGGITEPLVVKVNGSPVTIDVGDANEFTEFFAPLDADAPVESLRDNNKIEIVAQKGTTITSVQLKAHQLVD